MLKITCQHVYQHASDYLDGPVTPWQRALLFVHLVICKHCRRYIHHLKIAVGIAATIPPLAQPSETEIDNLARRLLAVTPDPHN